MTEPGATSHSASTRRSVLRTGAHLAWAVPAIQIVSQAPAFAVNSGPTAQLQVISATWNPNAKELANYTVDGVMSVTLKNVGEALATGVLLTLNQVGGDGFSVAVSVNCSGPTGALGGMSNGASKSYATGDIAAGDAATLQLGIYNPIANSLVDLVASCETAPNGTAGVSGTYPGFTFTPPQPVLEMTAVGFDPTVTSMGNDTTPGGALRVVVKNTGSETATGVTLTLTSTNNSGYSVSDLHNCSGPAGPSGNLGPLWGQPTAVYTTDPLAAGESRELLLGMAARKYGNPMVDVTLACEQATSDVEPGVELY